MLNIPSPNPLKGAFNPHSVGLGRPTGWGDGINLGLKAGVKALITNRVSTLRIR